MTFRNIGTLSIDELARQLAAKPELWDRNTERTGNPSSPHHGCSDIWLRYNAIQAKGDDYRTWQQPHVSCWHPAYFELPALRPLVFDVMHRVQGTALGGCLITRIPPGGEVKPHADTGWHPTHYNTKVYIPLAAPRECRNYSRGDSVVMGLGEAWVFDNTVEHRVVNNSLTESRITLIVCTRTEP